MQPGSVVPATAAALAAAKTGKVPDTASWQAALAQAAEEAGVQATPAPAATPVQDKPAVAKPSTKEAAVAVSPALAAAEKTLAQPGKKPTPVTVEGAVPAAQKSTKEEKAAATPVAIAVTQTVVDTAVVAVPPDTSPAASAPDAVHAAAAPVVPKLLPQIPSTTAPASPEDAAPATPHDMAATAASGHEATPGTALPQLSTAVLTQAAAPPAATPTVVAVTPNAAPAVTPQTPTATHAAASDVTHAAVTSVSAAVGSKVSPDSSSEDITITPPVAAATKDDSADKQTAIQPAGFAAPAVHDATAAQPPVPATATTTLPITQPSAAGACRRRYRHASIRAKTVPHCGSTRRGLAISPCMWRWGKAAR